MAQLFKNNASGKLAAAIDSDDTTIVLEAGQGSRFPTLGSGDYFMATFADIVAGREVEWEIVKVTAKVGDTLTIARAQEGTAARGWPIETMFEHRVTAGTMKELSVTTVSQAEAEAGTATTNRAWTAQRVRQAVVAAAGPAAPALDSMVILTSGTQWTCPAGVRLARIRGVGGCGGGGNGKRSSYGSGAAGGEFEAIVNLVAGTGYTYAIGAGGTAAAAPGAGEGNAGGLGGTTSITIGTLTFSATGGSGGGGIGAANGGMGTAPIGISKRGQPGGARAASGVVYGGVSSLGTQGGLGGTNQTGPGDTGKIVMELYK